MLQCKKKLKIKKSIQINLNYRLLYKRNNLNKMKREKKIDN